MSIIFIEMHIFPASKTFLISYIILDEFKSKRSWKRSPPSFV